MLALLGVAVLIVAVVALRHPKSTNPKAGTHKPPSHATVTATASGTGKPTPSPSNTPSRTPTTSGTSSATAGKLPLVVLNNTTTTGLAASAAERFRSGGWTVTEYSNYQNDIVSTCAYYDPSVPGAQAAALALQAQYPTIKRVRPQFSQLASYHSPIVVILTPDYSP